MMNKNTQTSYTLDYYIKDENLLQRHKLSLPPSESYLFIPSNTETVKYDEKNPKKTLRRIFESKDKQFLKFEEEKFEELLKEIGIYNQKKPKDKLTFPESYSKCEMRRFLQATSYDCLKTIKLLKDNIEWRRVNIPPKITPKVVELLNCGFLYAHGRDNSFRPIIVLNVDVYMKLREKYIFDDWFACVIFFMEYMINSLLIPGQVENWNVITDLGGVSLIFMPSDIKKFMAVLQENYRCRLFVNFVIGMSAILRGIWKFAKNFMDESTVKKVRFLKDDDHSELFEFINEEQIERKFGGRAPDVIPGNHNCFPPIMPSKSFLKNGQLSTGLINEGKYKELHETNKLVVTSEFFLNKWREEEEMKKVEELEKEKQEKISMVEVPNFHANNLYTIIEDDEPFSNSSQRIEDNFIHIISDEYNNENRMETRDMKKKLQKASVVRSLKECLGSNELLLISSPPIFPKTQLEKLGNTEKKLCDSREAKSGDNTFTDLKHKSDQYEIRTENISDQICSLADNENKTKLLIEEKKINEFCQNSCYIY